MLYGSRKTLDLIFNENKENIDCEDMLNELDQKMIELRKERQRLSDQRTAFNRLVRERSRQEELNDILVKAINASDLPELSNAGGSYYPYSDTDLLVSLNDIHYGATYDNHWGKYNSGIFAQMLKEYLDRIIAIGETHQSKDCIIWQNGDAISGNIHKTIQVTNKENVIEQVVGVSELIAEFMAELSKHFDTVKYASVSGNHSRIEPNKENSLVEERMDDLIEWYLKARLQNITNIEIGFGDKIHPTMYSMNVRGKVYCGVHGDFDATGSNIQSLQTMVGEQVYAVLLGHKHHNAVDDIQGIKTVMAGSFQGMDEYCVQKRIVGTPSQMVCVCDDHGILCHYDISL